jgi:hypothetical protein
VRGHPAGAGDGAAQAENGEAECVDATCCKAGNGNEACGGVAACMSLIVSVIALYRGPCQVSVISHPAVNAICAITPSTPNAAR